MARRKRRRGGGVVVTEQASTAQHDAEGQLPSLQQPQPQLQLHATAQRAVSDPALAEVWAWCKGRGGLNVNKLWPGYSASGRGLHATDSVQRGDLLLRVPAKVLFNTRSIRGDQVLGPLLRDAAAAGVTRLSPLATLCLGLIHERALGARSWWQPMIASFPEPEGMVTAEQFTELELERVPWAAALHEEARVQKQNLAAAAELVQGLLEWTGRSDAAVQSVWMWEQRDAYGAAGMSWAWSVVSTRACFMDMSKYQSASNYQPSSAVAASGTEGRATAATNNSQRRSGRDDDEGMMRSSKGSSAADQNVSDGTEDTSTLVPWLDLLNHNSAGQADAATAAWVANPGAQDTSLQSESGGPCQYEDGAYEVRSGTAVAAGKPVLLCYGELSNEVLLARYGAETHR